MTASVSGNKVGRGGQELFDDVLSAASQVRKREGKREGKSASCDSATAADREQRYTRTCTHAHMHTCTHEWEAVRLELIHNTQGTWVARRATALANRSVADLHVLAGERTMSVQAETPPPGQGALAFRDRDRRPYAADETP